MAVAFQAAGTGAYQAASTTVAVPYPTVSAGSLMVLHIVLRNTPIDTITTPSGWTLTYGPDPVYSVGDSPDAVMYIYTKSATGAESGSLTVTFSGTNSLKAARMYSFTGCSTSTFDGTSVFGGNDNVITHNSVTTTVAGVLVCAFIATQQIRTLTDFTLETGGNFTETTAEYAPNMTLGLQTAAMASTGTISGGEISITSGPFGVRMLSLIPSGTATSDTRDARVTGSTPVTSSAYQQLLLGCS